MPYLPARDPRSRPVGMGIVQNIHTALGSAGHALEMKLSAPLEVEDLCEDRV